MAKTINIKLVKSLNGRLAKHKATAEALGLRKIGDTTVQPDNEATRGKIAHIGYHQTHLCSQPCRETT